MRCSPQGRQLIQSLEGCRYTVYLDQAGFPTIGYGHMDKTLIPGQHFTQEQVDALFEKDIESVESCINSCIAESNLNQNQFDALCSFVFNVGNNAFRSSTLLKDVNAGALNRVPGEFVRWVYDNKQVDPILVHRRKIESELWQTPVTS